MSMLSRDTIMLTKAGTKIHLGTLIDNYGSKLLTKMIPSVYIFYHEPCNIKVKTQKARNAGCRNMCNGRPLHHISKTTGYLKNKYKKLSIQKALLEDFIHIIRFKPTQRFIDSVYIIQNFIRNKYKYLERNAIIIQKYVKRFLINICKNKALIMLNEGIDFTIDSITTENLYDPCIIEPDYTNGNFVLYNLSTIHKMVKTYDVPIYSIFNEITQEDEIFYRTFIERDYKNRAIFKSPYTRREFTMNDIISIKNNYIFIFGQAFQNQRNYGTKD